MTNTFHSAHYVSSISLRDWHKQKSTIPWAGDQIKDCHALLFHLMKPVFAHSRQAPFQSVKASPSISLLSLGPGFLQAPALCSDPWHCPCTALAPCSSLPREQKHSAVLSATWSWIYNNLFSLFCNYLSDNGSWRILFVKGREGERGKEERKKEKKKEIHPSTTGWYSNDMKWMCQKIEYTHWKWISFKETNVLSRRWKAAWSNTWEGKQMSNGSREGNHSSMKSISSTLCCSHATLQHRPYVLWTLGFAPGLALILGNQVIVVRRKHLVIQTQYHSTSVDIFHIQIPKIPHKIRQMTEQKLGLCLRKRKIISEVDR